MLALIAAFSFSEFFSAVVSFEALHWQGQVATLISLSPSIITALAPYPKEQGFAQSFFKFLNLFSVLSHKDSPSTLKAPFTQSLPPAVVGSPVSPGAGKPPPGFAIVPFVFLVAVAAILATVLVRPTAPGAAAVPGLLAALGLGLVVLLAVWLVSRKAETWREWKHRTGHYLLPALLVASLGAAAPAKAFGFDCSTPVFGYGLSLAITEISPSNPHPVGIAEGAGFMANVGLCQFALLGKSWDAIDLNVMGLGSVISPQGAPQGALQLGGGIGSFNNTVALEVLSTPWTASGGGWVQGGRPGTTFGLILNIPFNIGPTSPPVGMPEAGPRQFPRGSLLDLVGT